MCWYVNVVLYGELVKVLDDYGTSDVDFNALIVECDADLRSPLSLASHVVRVCETQLLLDLFIAHEPDYKLEENHNQLQQLRQQDIGN